MNCSQKHHIPYRKVFTYVIAIISVIAHCPLLLSQGVRHSTLGKDFIVSFLPNFHNNVSDPLRRPNDSLIVFCSGVPGTNIEFLYRNRAGARSVTQLTMPESGVCSLAVSWVNYEARGFNNSGLNFTTGDNGRVIQPYFRIKADAEIAAYAHNQAVTTSDATLLYPTHALGKNYMILSYPSDGKSAVNQTTDQLEMTLSSTPSEAIITANENDTKITVKTENDLVNQFDVSGQYAREFSFTLQEGESVLLQTLIQLGNLRADISGTTIESDKPVAVFAGHQRTQAPLLSNYNGMSRDHLFEQLPPLEQWGYEFLLLGFPKDYVRFITYDAYRVIASEDMTTIYEGSRQIALLKKGQVYEGRIAEPLHLRADKPVLVAQIRASSQNSQTNNGSGDPFMIYVPPKDLYLHNYTFCAIQGYGTEEEADEMVYGDHYITIIIPTIGIASLRLDNTEISASNFKQFPVFNLGKTCLSYSYTTLFVRQGTHKIFSDYPFALFSFGYGTANSYGYIAGVGTGTPSAPVVPLAVSNDTIICQGSSVQLFARGGGAKYRWFPDTNISCTDCDNPVVTPDNSIIYYVSTTDSNNCTYIDSVNVIVSKATALVSNDTTICLGSSAQLFAKGGVKYEWRVHPTLSCVTCPNPIAKPVKDTTTYYVRIYNEQNCSIVDSVTISTSPTTVKIKGNNEACVGDSIRLYAEGALEYEWFTQDSVLCKNCTDIIIYPKAITRIYVKGSFRAECYGIDSLDIIGREIEVKTINDTVICLGSSVQLTTKSTAKKYKWEPSLFLSCDTCQSPIVTPLFPIQYTVSVTDGICFGFDTVNINTADVNVRISAEDTILCLGSTTSIRANSSNNVIYNWHPKTNTYCDTCSEILVSPKQTTTYICTVQSKENCIAHDTITVYVRTCISKNNIQFPDILTCDTATRIFTLVNDNPKQEKRLVSIQSLDNNSPFSLLSPKDMKFEQRYNEQTDLVFQFSPQNMGNFENTFVIESDDNEVIELTLTGKGLQTFINQQHSDTNDIIPGHTVLVPIRFVSKDWYIIPSKEYHVKAQYNSRHFNFSGEIINPSSLPLEFTIPIIERAQKTTTITFTIKSPNPFERDITPCVLPFTQLLHDNKKSEMFVSILSDSPQCVFVDTMRFSTTVFACFTDGRLVSTSSTPYSFTTEQHEDHHIVHCSIGLSGHTVIHCHSLTGEKLGTLFDSYTPEGQLSITIPHNHFSNGLYYITIHSGIYNKTIPLYIQH
ncbi:MAG: hypothetical protein ACK5C0_15205 [Candidatus Kapaibacterium sp.]|jgi:hypothetical protein